MLREFPDVPVVKTLCFHCRGHRFHPWSGNWGSTGRVGWPNKNNCSESMSECFLKDGSSVRTMNSFRVCWKSVYRSIVTFDVWFSPFSMASVIPADFSVNWSCRCHDATVATVTVPFLSLKSLPGGKTNGSSILAAHHLMDWCWLWNHPSFLCTLSFL